MYLIGITGSIGSGKTTLANIVKELGFAVYDVDAWVRKIYNNKKFLGMLSKEFPEVINGEIVNKKYLRNIVFNDIVKLQKLENLIYPFLNEKIQRQRHCNAKNKNIVFLDAALLFEKGWNKYCDLIILADVDYNKRMQRVISRDNISEADFRIIDNLQISNEDKKFLSDLIVNTDKPLNILKVEMIKLIEKIYGDL